MVFTRSRVATSAAPAAGRDRIRASRRQLLPAAVICAAAVAAAGCAAGGAGGKTASSSRPTTAAAKPAPASQVLALAASQAKHVTSLSATLNVTTTGTSSSQVSGTLTEQLRPTLLAAENFTITSNGVQVPGGLQTVMTGNAMYLKMSTLASLVGKPWVEVPFSALKKRAGVNFAPLIHQLETNNPLTAAEMLPASTGTHEVGTQVINGVPTTEYAGTLNLAAALSRLSPSLRKLMQPALAATGVTTAQYTVWVDSQHQIRKLAETENGTTAQIKTVIVITAVNQPVHIKAPPAHEVGSIPGL